MPRLTNNTLTLTPSKLKITQSVVTYNKISAHPYLNTLFLRKGKSFFLERKKPRTLAEEIIEQLEVVTPNANTPVRMLSGGNVQKILVGREIAAAPTVLMVAYPVRGLDINSSYTIFNLLNEQKKKGAAVILVGEDLDVLIELCDRIMVIGNGKISGIVDGRTTTKEEIGLLMTRTDGGENNGKN